MPCFKLAKYENDFLFLDKDDLDKYREDLASDAIRQIFTKYKICFSNKDIIKHFTLDNRRDIEIERRGSRINARHEWINDIIYHNWKELTGYSIYISNAPFNISIIITSDNEKLCNSEIGNKPYYREKKDIFVQSSDNESKNVLKQLAAYQDFDEGFIKLQSMFLEDLMSEKTIKVTKELEELGKQFNNEQVKQLAEKKDKIEKALDDNMDWVDKKELDELRRMKDDQPTKEPTYGYIGELLYKKYLESKNSNFEHSSKEKKVPEYDFKVGKVYLDIKTTVQELENGEAPLYIHKNTHKFLKNNPKYDFRIIRVSLKDLEIYAEAKNVKDRFKDNEKGEDYEKACSDVAEQYWKNHKPKDFLKKLHEYKINSIVEGPQ